MSLPATMSGVYLTGHGGPEKLEWREDIPVPRPGRVRCWCGCWRRG